LKKGITIVLIVVCVVVFGYSAYQLLSYYSANSAAERDFAQLLPPDLASADAGAEDGDSAAYLALLPYYDGLRAQNSDMVGWLRIPGSRISYPVMQTINSPEYYLDKDFKKNYQVNGSLFASNISDVNLPSDVVIIYGHRMKSGAMFGRMGDFLNQDYLSKNDTVVFDTFTARNVYKIYCLFSLSVDPSVNVFDYYDYNQFGDEQAFNDFMAQVQGLANIVNPSNAPKFGDKILLLSTCEYTHADGRLVMVAVRTNEIKRPVAVQ